MRRNAGTIMSQAALNAFLAVFSLLAILPFALLILSSFTSEKVLLADGYSYFPRQLSLEAYHYLFVSNGPTILRAYGVTVFVTAAGTALSMMVAPMLAYCLSRKDYARSRALTFAVLFTMLFNGGLVPQYLMWTQLFHVKNTIVSLILPNLLFNGFYILLMKNYFALNVHPALIESAKIDGANEFLIYRKIVVPLSLPILATIGLMAGIAYWNDWMNGLIYLTDEKLFSLQNLLNRILTSIRYLNDISASASLGMDFPSVSIRMAMAVIGFLPIMLLYPFFQRYFIKGITLGGVKG